jgi:Rrf2 family protein
MKLNTKVRYAFRLMADIAGHGQDAPVALKDVAQRQDLSKLYLSQLTGALKSASLLKSVWGNKGGYELARPASEISLLDVFQAVDGPLAIVNCVHDSESCNRTAFCECHLLWWDINQAMVDILSRHSLASLIPRDSPKSKANPLCKIDVPPGKRARKRVVGIARRRRTEKPCKLP